jgi:hypothetical protein
MKFVFVSVNNNPVLHARENNTGCAPWQHFEKIFFREENMSSLALILKVLSWRVDLIHLPTGNCS